jgi:hypothetical protein
VAEQENHILFRYRKNGYRRAYLLLDSCLKIPDPGPDLTYVIANIEYECCKKIKYQREAGSQKRGINKKQADLGDGNIKLFTKIRANAKGLFFEKD